MYINTYDGISRKTTILYTSGWKTISMIDIYGSVTFTLWLCGCNLKCPFCHNWRLAINDKKYCHKQYINTILQKLEISEKFIDYLHVTGGEPLLQYKGVITLFKYVKEQYIVKTSLNTNLTLYKPLELVLRKELVDHIASDLKTPFNKLIGYPENIANKLWNNYVRSLKLIMEYNILLELRVPVAHIIYREGYNEMLEIIRLLSKYDNFYIIIQPLLGHPITTPRNIEWCKKYCNPDESELLDIVKLFELHGISKTYIKNPVMRL